MVHKASIAWKVALAFLLGAAVVFASPVMGAQVWAADDAKVAFDITAGEPGRMLNILNTIDETREGFLKQGMTPRFVLAFRGPALTADADRPLAPQARGPRHGGQGGRQAQAAAHDRRHRAAGAVQHRHARSEGGQGPGEP